LGFIYNIGINITRFGLKCVAPFNKKIDLGVRGRTNTFNILKNGLNDNDKTLWFHCASLGEYEQGLPVFKELKKFYPNHKIVLSFFSPSGYEIKKDNSIADVVVYLPLDTKQNASKFLDIVKPELTVFVKYEFWPNFLNTLKENSYRSILISALFRENQAFFKFYGSKLKEALFSFEHIFTQNNASKLLLNSINYYDVTVSGDTRFDRVLSQLEQNNILDFIEEFKQDKLCIVAGSTWPEDETLFIEYINSQASEDLKFIIAPHNIKATQIRKLQKGLKVNSILHSEIEGKNLSNYHVLIIDAIGFLSKAYNYADIAYVGGAMGTTGLHNTLEAAVFGIPIIIGNNYSKFPEANDMIKNKGMFSVSSQNEFNIICNSLVENSENRTEVGALNFAYVKKNAGAIVQIMTFLRK